MKFLNLTQHVVTPSTNSQYCSIRLGLGAPAIDVTAMQVEDPATCFVRVSAALQTRQASGVFKKGCYEPHLTLLSTPLGQCDNKEAAERERMESVTVTPKTAGSLQSPKILKTAKPFPTITSVPNAVYGCGKLL